MLEFVFILEATLTFFVFLYLVRRIRKQDEKINLLKEIVTKSVVAVDELVEASFVLRDIVTASLKISKDNQIEMAVILENIEQFKKCMVDFSLAVTQKIEMLESTSQKKGPSPASSLLLTKKNDKEKPN